MTDTSTALALPDEQQFKADIEAINQFQKVVRANMIEGQDYGVIPGTTKPTLLKPGAEKIAKLLGLADEYEILDRQEDWGKPFFRYLIKCRLIAVRTGTVISEGLGECNSMEARYRWRWLWPREIPDDQKGGLVTRPVKGGGVQYRLPNEDIFSQVNTLVKMSKKRALVDAALSAGRLSQVFTQDIEDMGSAVAKETAAAPASKPAATKEERMCPVHGVAFFKKGKMKGWAHPIEGSKDWCAEGNAAPAPTPEVTEQTRSAPSEKSEGQVYLSLDRLGYIARQTNWTDLGEYLAKTYGIEADILQPSASIPLLSEEQQTELMSDAELRLAEYTQSSN